MRSKLKAEQIVMIPDEGKAVLLKDCKAYARQYERWLVQFKPKIQYPTERWIDPTWKV